MTDRDDEPGPTPSADKPGWGQHYRAHAKALSVVAVASGFGIAASFIFQILSARYLAPADFGLLSAFFVIVNVAAIGSSSLQNIVIVQTAENLAHPGKTTRRRRWPIDALAIGLAGGAAVCVAAPWIAAALDTTPAIVIAAAVTIPLSFVFADALGLLQGSGRISTAVWWSTNTQIARVVLLVAAVAIGAGLGGTIGAVIAATAVGLAGALWSARRIARPTKSVFSTAGLTIVALTVAFAWLTSSDVIFLRAGASEELAGTYAAVAVLVKTGFLIPSTLSLYLLPRFVRNRDNPQLSRVGVLVTLVLSLATSIAMIAFFAILGPWLVPFLFGSAYAGAVELLVPVALAYLPWIAAQGLLIKMTSSASKTGAVILILAVIAQAVTFPMLIPDIAAMLTAFAIIGAVVLIAFLLFELVPPKTRAGKANASV